MHITRYKIILLVFLYTLISGTSCAMHTNANRYELDQRVEKIIAFTPSEMKLIFKETHADMPTEFLITDIQNPATRIHQHICSFNKNKKRFEIIYAASIGAFNVVHALLLCGKNPNEMVNDGYGSTALVDSIIGGFFEVVTLLLAYGANQELTTNSGYSPLNTAQSPYVDLRFIIRGRSENSLIYERKLIRNLLVWLSRLTHEQYAHYTLWLKQPKNIPVFKLFIELSCLLPICLQHISDLIDWWILLQSYPTITDPHPIDLDAFYNYICTNKNTVISWAINKSAPYPFPYKLVDGVYTIPACSLARSTDSRDSTQALSQTSHHSTATRDNA